MSLPFSENDADRTRGDPEFSPDVSVRSPSHAQTVTHVPSSAEISQRDQPTRRDERPLEQVVPHDPALPHIDGFEIIGRLGRGGMGVVYQARDTRLGRLVAIKVLRVGSDANDEDLARFQQEAKIIAQLRHPHVVQVYEVGESHGVVYLVLEYMNGGALSAFLDGTPLDPRLAAEIIATLADGAAAAHQVGVVHRDLKPGNVLVSLPEQQHSEPRRSDPSRLRETGVTLKLADFGLAKNLSGEDSQTMTGVMMGTPRYAAPEQVRGEIRAISPATDVYALGAMLYELLTGASVFRGANVIELFDAIRTAEPISPRVLRPNLDRDLETICLKSLRKSPKERYPNAADLRADLSRWLAHEPIRARPSGVVERAAKWVRRNRGPTALIGVSVLATMVSLALALSMEFQSRLSKKNDELSSARLELKGKNEELEKQNGELEVAKSTAIAAETEAKTQRDLLARHRYAVDMETCGRAWREGDIARVETLLRRNLPANGDAADLRGFEWYYLQGLLRNDTGKLTGDAAVYTSDGKFVAVAMGGVVSLLAADTRHPIRLMESEPVQTARLAFSRDGSRLIGACYDAKFRVWNVADGKLLRVFDKHSHSGRAALSPDGSLALTMGMANDRTAKLWRVDDGEVLVDWSAGGGNYAGDFDFSPDGRWFAVGWPLTNTVRIAKVESPNEFIEVSVADISTVRFDPSSQWLYVSQREQVGRIAIENVSPSSTIEPTKINGRLLAFGADGRMLATATDANSLRIWQVATQHMLNERKGHVGGYDNFSFMGSTAEGVSSSPTEHTIRFCGALENQEFTGLNYWLRYSRSVKFSPDGKTIALAGGDPGVVLFDGRDFRKLEPALGNIWAMAFSPDGKWIAATGYEGKCRLWKRSDGELAQEISHPTGRPFFGLAFDAEGKRLAIGGGEGHVPIWNLEEMREVGRGPGSGDIFSVAFRPDSDEFIVHSSLTLIFHGKRTMRGWNHVSAANLLFTRDGTGLFTLTMPAQDGVTLVDADTRETRQTFAGHQAHVSCMALSPDGTRLATASADRTVKLWDVASGQVTLTLPTDEARALDFSPDGRKLLVGTVSGVVRVYDTSLGYDPR